MESKEESRLPSWIKDRESAFEKYHVRELERLEAAKAANEPITVNIPNKDPFIGVKHVTTPYQVGEAVYGKGFADRCLVATVDGKEWDLNRPLVSDCTIELHNYEKSDLAKYVFQHSSAHMLGYAMEVVFGCMLNRGPPQEDGGFFYEGGMEGMVSETDYEKLQKVVDDLIKLNAPFERVELSKEEASEMFSYNKYKDLEEKEGDVITVYRCGPFIDPCTGPHIPRTGVVKAFAVTKNSSAYFKGDSDLDVLQRVYGIAFPNPKMLKQWLHVQEEAAKRDHRKIGRDQDLFFFDPVSAGSCFFLPNGEKIYERLIGFMKRLIFLDGYEMVISPNIFNSKLWMTSGHWQNYRENMFSFSIKEGKGEESIYGLKPMNCPGHAVMYLHKTRSWRELPLRWAEFGIVHRNELSGALSGLIRVRKFVQDDAHIFCAKEDVGSEVLGCLNLMQRVYSTFGLDFELILSTMPEKHLGTEDMWKVAESQLEYALKEFGKDFTVNPGDGAFYGPKIDVVLLDALHRKHQCATVQLDFNLPERFHLTYMSKQDKEETCAIIHRAILGSVERFIAILTEHFAGKWPFWISPRQARIITVNDTHIPYARSVRAKLMEAGYHVEIDDSDKTVPKKVREAQLAQFNFILVVGNDEISDETVNVRTRDNVVHGKKKIEELLKEFDELMREHK